MVLRVFFLVFRMVVFKILVFDLIDDIIFLSLVAINRCKVHSRAILTSVKTKYFGKILPNTTDP